MLRGLIIVLSVLVILLLVRSGQPASPVGHILTFSTLFTVSAIVVVLASLIKLRQKLLQIGSARVLVVESNYFYGNLILETLGKSLSKRRISILHNAKECLDVLAAQHNFSSHPPSVLLLGEDAEGASALLHAVKNEENWKQIPVVLLTFDHSVSAITSGYKRNADYCLPKPILSSEFSAVAKLVERLCCITEVN